MPSNAKWSQTDSVKQNPFKQDSSKQSQENTEKTACQIKQSDLRSVLDTHSFPAAEKTRKPIGFPAQNEENLEKKFIVDGLTKPKSIFSMKIV